MENEKYLAGNSSDDRSGEEVSAVCMPIMLSSEKIVGEKRKKRREVLTNAPESATIITE